MYKFERNRITPRHDAGIFNASAKSGISSKQTLQQNCFLRKGLISNDLPPPPSISYSLNFNEKEIILCQCTQAGISTDDAKLDKNVIKMQKNL